MRTSLGAVGIIPMVVLLHLGFFATAWGNGIQRVERTEAFDRAPSVELPVWETKQRPAPHRVGVNEELEVDFTIPANLKTGTREVEGFSFEVGSEEITCVRVTVHSEEMKLALALVSYGRVTPSGSIAGEEESIAESIIGVSDRFYVTYDWDESIVGKRVRATIQIQQRSQSECDDWQAYFIRPFDCGEPIFFSGDAPRINLQENERKELLVRSGGDDEIEDHKLPLPGYATFSDASLDIQVAHEARGTVGIRVHPGELIRDPVLIVTGEEGMYELRDRGRSNESEEIWLMLMHGESVTIHVGSKEPGVIEFLKLEIFWQ